MHYHRLTLFHRLFSWTSVGLSKWSTKWSACQANWISAQFPEYHVHHLRTFWNEKMFKGSIIENFIVLQVKLACIIKQWFVTGQQSFINCSPNVQSTKWSLLNAIWMSEQFPACNKASSRGPLNSWWKTVTLWSILVW